MERETISFQERNGFIVDEWFSDYQDLCREGLGTNDQAAPQMVETNENGAWGEMSEIVSKWLHNWHEILDRELGPDANNRGYDLNDLDCDFRRHFCTWSLPDAAIRECFEMLPRGSEIANRVLDADTWTAFEFFDEDECRDRFRQAIRDVSHFVNLGFTANAPIRFERGRADYLRSVGAEDAIEFEILTEDVWEPLTASFDDEMCAAYSFVSETLYQRTTLHEGVYYSLWPFIEAPPDIDPFANLLRIRQSLVSFMKDDDGLFVFFDEDQTIRDGAVAQLKFSTAGYHDISAVIEEQVSLVAKKYLAFGFPEARFELITIGLHYPQGYRVVVRPADAPEQADEDERPYTGIVEIRKGKLALKDGYSLFFHENEEDHDPREVTIDVHIVDGRRQRGEPLYP